MALKQVAVFLAGVLMGGAAAAQTVDALTPEQVLQRVRAVYEQCVTYRDSGLVREESDGNGLHFVQEKTFRTAFVRPDRFRFEFRTTTPLGDESVHIIWADGDEVRTWWDVAGGEVERETLRMALAAAAGISSRLSSRVPTLLMPAGAFGGGIQLAELTRDGGETVDGRISIRLRGRQVTMPSSLDVGGRTVSVEDGGMVLWIDRETLLLRRVESVVIIDGNRTVTTTTYDAVVDEPVDESLLAFAPPGS